MGSSPARTSAMPTSAASWPAARGLSPVSRIGGLLAVWPSARTAAAASGRSRSASARTPAGVPSTRTSTAVCPAACTAATRAPESSLSLPVGVPSSDAGERDREAVSLDGGGDTAPGLGVELARGRDGQAAVSGAGDDGAGQRVFAGVARPRRPSRQDVVGVESGQAMDGDEAWGAVGEGAGLVERDDVDVAELLHHHGGLDQHAVPAGVGDRRQQRRHGGQHDRARRGDDHEGHRAQQRRLQGRPGRERDSEQRPASRRPRRPSSAARPSR